MPLSEHEQHLLEQMERALYAEDPKFASSLRGRDPRSNFRRRVLLAGTAFVVGQNQLIVHHQEAARRFRIFQGTDFALSQERD